jgi:signal transduction histidine kinase/ActR/RegA family two-component response regulator
VENKLTPELNNDTGELRQLWAKEFEARSLFGHRMFCLTFLFAYPLTSILYYLNGNPDYKGILVIQLTCSVFVAMVTILHFEGKITGHDAAFWNRILLILFHSFIMWRFETLYFYALNINLTLQLIFSIWVIYWRPLYASISSATAITLFSVALYGRGPDVLVNFLREGGMIFYMSLCVFPLIMKMKYGRIYREFIYLQKLARQNRELEQQNKLAQEATQAKSDFLSMMSHEIRTPLNGIVGMIHLMLQENLRTTFQREMVETMKFSSDHLMAVVNKVLDFNKINSDHVKLLNEPFDLARLLKNVEKTFISRAEEKGLNLIFEVDDTLPEQLTGDSVRLNQVLTNLIHNAIKFTQKGFVKLVVREEKRDPLRIWLHFEVCDSGVGIPAEEHAAVFEIFTQSSNEELQGNRGTGLGLAITKEILRLFESEIKLESEPDKGSRFFFTIKLPYRTETLVEEKPAEVVMNLPEARVLVVDDNAINLMFAMNLLKKMGLQFDTAANGAEAIEMYNNTRYDLILMDLRMPVMSGFDAARHLREEGATIPIIALSASAFTNERESALANGFTAYLVKPFLPDEFYQVVSTHLSTQNQRISV